MMTSERVLFFISIFCAWGSALFMSALFASGVSSLAFFILLFLLLIVWLAPIFLMLLLIPGDKTILLVFGAGLAGFLLVSHGVYALISFALLFAGFWYWRFRVTLALVNAQIFSPLIATQGINWFFTILALMLSVLIFNAPILSRVSFEPKIPEPLFNAIYEPVKEAIISELNGINSIKGEGETRLLVNLKDESFKNHLYKSINASLERLALVYKQYIPFFFAAGVFILLKALLSPFQYLMAGITGLVIRILLSLGVLKEEKIQVEKKVITFHE